MKLSSHDHKILYGTPKSEACLSYLVDKMDLETHSNPTGKC
jgi:hypothetical protein